MHRIPLQAWCALQAKGVVLPYEYAQEPAGETAAAAATRATFMTLTCAAVRVQASRRQAVPQRQNRRQQLTLIHSSDDHLWVKQMLLDCELQVNDDVLFDHSSLRLMHYGMHGMNGMPSGAMMDEDYAAILADMGGEDSGNMVPQLRQYMMGAYQQNLQPDNEIVQMADESPSDTPLYEMQTPTAPVWSSDEDDTGASEC